MPYNTDFSTVKLSFSEIIRRNGAFSIALQLGCRAVSYADSALQTALQTVGDSQNVA